MKTLLISLGLLIALATTPAAQVPTVINIEIDYMQQGLHSHEPNQAVLDAVVDMFACQGIQMNLVVSQAIPHVNIIQCDDPDNDNFWDCRHANSFSTMKTAFAQTNQTPGWHYCIIGHFYDSGDGIDSSGKAEIDGNDLIVTLGGGNDGTGTDFQVAATLVHELGHNLGLGHVSPNTTGATGEYSPNYASLMAYQYQLSGVATKMECLGLVGNVHRLKDLDYSSGRMPRLDEGALRESRGVGIHGVDWNCNGSFDSGTVMRDLDGDEDWCAAPSGSSVLDDYDDWANIRDTTGDPAVFLDLTAHDSETCASIRSALPPPGPADVDDPLPCFEDGPPTLTTETCPSGLMVWVDPNASAGSGIGRSPYNDLSIAYGVSPDESVLYLQPGTYTNGGTALLFDRPMVLAGPGGAVVAP